MYIAITRQHLGNQYQGSARDFVNYLEKENEGKSLEEQERFFNQTEHDIDAERVIAEIDANTAKLSKRDPKFYSIMVSPSQAELRHIGNDPEKLRQYTRELMKTYAAAFYRDREVTDRDILYFAKLERERTYSEKDRQVKENQPYASKILELQHQVRAVQQGLVQGDIAKLQKRIQVLEQEAPHQQKGKRIVPGMAKEGHQSHIHIIVSLLDRKNRLIVSGGNRRDIEQLGISLTSTNDVMGRSIASSSLVTVGANDRLTNINLSTLNVEMEPVKNFRINVGGSFRTLSSALPEAFSLDYVDPGSPTGISSEVKQFDLNTTLIYTPGKRTIGYGVERADINDNYSTLVLKYTKGVDGFLESDFDYEKIQFSYQQPWQIGGFGRLTSSVELGKTFGEVPLSLLSVIPGNQTLFSLYNVFPNLDFYEFVTDTYATVHLEHNFNGRLFSRIPLLRKFNLREIVGLRGAWGQLSDANVALSAPTNIPLIAPDDQIYWEYSFGVGNIFKILRIDFNFRGNYLDNPDARPFGITGTFGFSF